MWGGDLGSGPHNMRVRHRGAYIIHHDFKVNLIKKTLKIAVCDKKAYKQQKNQLLDKKYKSALQFFF